MKKISCLTASILFLFGHAMAQSDEEQIILKHAKKPSSMEQAFTAEFGDTSVYMKVRERLFKGGKFDPHTALIDLNINGDNSIQHDAGRELSEFLAPLWNLNISRFICLQNDDKPCTPQFKIIASTVDENAPDDDVSCIVRFTSTTTIETECRYGDY